MAAEQKKRICKKCGHSLTEGNFYKTHEGEYVDICKKCLTLHVNAYQEETFLWILEMLNFPYVKHVWNKTRDRAYARNHNLTGLSVFGSYIGAMRLRTWSDYVWADSERLNAEHEELQNQTGEFDEEYEELLKQQLENGEISEAQYRTLSSSATQIQDDIEQDLSRMSEFHNASSNAYVINADMVQPADPMAIAGGNNRFVDSAFMSEDELIDLGAELTREDKIHLAMK